MNHIKRTPIDVVKEIINYLYFSKSLKNILYVNKTWNNLVKESKFMEEYKIIQENFTMYLEDCSKNNNKNLIKMWNKYNNWKWPENKILSVKLNNYVDVYDKINCWCPAKIIGNSIHSCDEMFEGKIEVQFLGWYNDFIEYVTIDKIRPLGTKTINPNFKYESLKKLTTYSWILYEKSYGWDYAKIKTMEVNENNIIAMIEGSLVKLTKENIDDKIKICTNANAQLCKKNIELFTNRIYKY
jgi:hypothetical protein